MRNWAGNVTYRAARVHEPTSTAELQEVVAGARKVRALGTGHSFNRIADTEHDLVSVRRLPPRIGVGARQVRLSAGLRYGDLTPVLHRHGLALANLGSLPHISVAGAVATGTHGSGRRNQALAAAVAEVELVTADGQLRRLTRADPDFAGVVVSLGMLGVVTELVLHVVPAFDLRQYVVDDVPFDSFIGALDEVLDSARSVSAFTTWRAPLRVRVWRKQDVGAPPPPHDWLGGRLASTPRHPVAGLPPEHTTEQLGVVGPWHERLPHFRLDHTPSSGEELQSEWFVHRDHAVAALAALAEVSDRIGPAVQVAEVRTVAADSMWLSPAYGRDSVTLHVTWVPDAAVVTPLVALVEERLAPFDPRPHWGKVFGCPVAQAAERYPRAGEFAALARRLDPRQVFVNDFVAGLLG